ncbi:carbohydrate ABC transporter permease [Anaerobium acetethylicum]|uniref:Multiple sugar transport system permease protein n=1 Tax=Anaerobium acetethylicum TaxID=1619234 RepID=A0A1D3TW16_9FIRM|nr:sugar ABC transporter permease [Anaerobium acetethylicum]SCP98387.1 multiple sugar transport system permease protein [Anaerobium acetethylicum]
MKKKKKIISNTTIEGYCFVLPSFIFMLALIGYPLIYNIILSFKNYDVKTFKGNTSVFVGLDNYATLFSDSTFWLVMRNTLLFTIACLIVQFSIGFLFALLFHQKFKLSGPVRGLLLISYMMPMSVTALLSRNMFMTDGGVINVILQNFHLIDQPIEWLTNTKWAIRTVIIANCWVGIPFNMLLLTTGLTGISTEIYESGKVDGANSFQRFFYLTLPLLKPAIMAVLMLGFIYTFKAFDLIYIMTGGGPLNSTDVLGTYAYQLAFSQYKFSMGSAVAVVLFLCLFVVGLFYLKMTMAEEVD